MAVRVITNCIAMSAPSRLGASTVALLVLLFGVELLSMVKFGVSKSSMLEKNDEKIFGGT